MKAKIITESEAAMEANELRAETLSVVLVSGCYDLIHRGHVELLEHAYLLRPNGRVFVGLNSDDAIRELKGEGRPINDYMSRATVMASIMYVYRVFRIDDVRVTSVIRSLRPAHWVKGGDWTLATLDKGEMAAAKDIGAKVSIFKSLPGFSTTNTINKLTV